MKKFGLVILLLLATLLSGCEELTVIPVREKCPGKANVSEALDALNSSSSHTQPFIAYGKGRVRFYNSEKDKYEKHDISAIKIWFEPPGKFRFWGDVVFNNRGLDVGANETEFWFAAMPKELGNMYIWGLWSQQSGTDNLFLSPKIMGQAFGYIEIEKDKRFSLITGQYQDVLVQRDVQNRVTKKIFIDNCHYRVAKVEYFDVNQRVFAVLELSDYLNIDGEMTLPTKIQIINLDGMGNSDTINIILKSVKTQDTIKAAIFSKPATKRFKNIYKLVNGEAVKQTD